MARKTGMTKESIPMKSTTNGGNGSYMRRKQMPGSLRMEKKVYDRVAGAAPAIPRWLPGAYKKG